MTSRVLLIYVICTHFPINIGKIINTNIKACVYESNARSIFFPSTITALLKYFGVNPPFVTLSSMMINKIFWNRCDESEGPKREPGKRENPRQGYPIAQLTLMRQLSYQFNGIAQQFAQLVIKNDKAEDNMAERLGRIEEKMDTGFHRSEHMSMQNVIYNSSPNCDFSNMMRSMGESWGFLNLPLFPVVTWADPATTPIPQFFHQNNLQNQLPLVDEIGEPLVPPIVQNRSAAMSIQSSVLTGWKEKQEVFKIEPRACYVEGLKKKTFFF
ncbi:uncharacterized protein LOC132640809 [Lycium barbarum]|uniref:uncharacterized protein LOC132640809 n=1 Tax=Lycium barbarum TaxID=112863 RepID=UPI00293E53B3|nr:uncharacterized protein LOC132640809 [Lycium barbarum]